MEAITGFFAGLMAWAGFVFAIPVALSVMLVAIMLAMKVLGSHPPVEAHASSWLAFDPEASYAPGHTWLREVGAKVQVGLDDLALRLLPNIAELKVAEAGRAIAVGEPLAVLKLGAQEVTIPAPVAGRVTAHNKGGTGSSWFVELELVGEGFRALPHGKAARAWMDQEAGRLVAFAEHELGMAAADGGEVAIHSVDSVPEEKWRALIKDFLKSEPRKA